VSDLRSRGVFASRRLRRRRIDVISVVHHRFSAEAANETENRYQLTDARAAMSRVHVTRALMMLDECSCSACARRAFKTARSRIATPRCSSVVHCIPERASARSNGPSGSRHRGAQGIHVAVASRRAEAALARAFSADGGDRILQSSAPASHYQDRSKGLESCDFNGLCVASAFVLKAGLNKLDLSERFSAVSEGLLACSFAIAASSLIERFGAVFARGLGA
jgi:hypothetical protein